MIFKHINLCNSLQKTFLYWTHISIKEDKSIFSKELKHELNENTLSEIIAYSFKHYKNRTLVLIMLELIREDILNNINFNILLLGDFYFIAGKYNSVLGDDYYLKAKKIYSEENKIINVLECNLGLADIYMKKYLDKSIQHYEENKELIDKNIINNAEQFYYNIIIVKFLRKLNKYCSSHSNKVMAQKALIELGLIYKDLNLTDYGNKLIKKATK